MLLCVMTTRVRRGGKLLVLALLEKIAWVSSLEVVSVSLLQGMRDSALSLVSDFPKRQTIVNSKDSCCDTHHCSTVPRFAVCRYLRGLLSV